MINLIKNIEKAIPEINSKINDKTLGINYLEKLKYLLIDAIKEMNIETSNKIENLDNQNIIIIFGENKLSINLDIYKEAITKIKKNIQKDYLCIVLEGFISIDIYDNLKTKEFQSINLFSKTGMVLTQNTLITESIAKDSILLYIINDRVSPIKED